MMTGKQTDPPPAAANRHPPTHPTTRRAGEQIEASKLGRAGERGQGERKRITRKHGDRTSHHLIARPPHIKASIAPRTSRRPTSKEPARRHPVAIPSRGKQPSPPPSHRIRSSRTGMMTEARQIDHGIAQHPKHGHAHAAAGMTSRGKQAAPSAPRSSTRRAGRGDKTTRGEPRRAKR